MSEPRKLSPAETWRALEEQAAADEIDRVLALSDAHVCAELREMGVDTDEAARSVQRAIEAALAATAGKAPAAAAPDPPRPSPLTVVKGGAKDTKDAPARRAPWSTTRWTLTLAAAAVLLLVIGGGAKMVATRSPYTPPPYTTIEKRPPGPPPEALAVRARDEAIGECLDRHFGSCNDELAQATRLDPAMANDPRAAQARAAIWEYRVATGEEADSKMPQHTAPHAGGAASMEPPYQPPPPLTEQQAAARGLVAGLPAPYDFDADVKQRTTDALAHVGKHGAVRVEGLFVVSAQREGATLDGAVKLVHDVYAAYTNRRFVSRPERAVSIYVFESDAAYRAECARHPDPSCGPYGWYRANARDIGVDVATAGLGTIAHEMLHPMIEEDFRRAPTWFDEGLASLYETHEPLTTPGEIQGTDWSWRVPRLQRALASKSEREGASLGALFEMRNDDFEAQSLDWGPKKDDAIALHYAMARAACRWLEKQGKLWTFYRAWRDGSAHGDSLGTRAFASVVGKTPAEADAEWEQWVRGLLGPYRR